MPAIVISDDDDPVRLLAGGRVLEEGTELVDFARGIGDELGLADESFDLLASLYAGLVSEYCTRYLRVGGTLLVNSSHGDAAMASIDSRYRLAGVVTSRAGNYRVSMDGLDSYLIPKRSVEVTAELLHRTGRGIAYTRSPFAYLFQRAQ